MNGSGDIFFCNILWRFFLGPYSVKYFLYQYLRYYLLSFSRRIFHYLTRRLRFFTGRAEKTVNTFLPKSYKFWTTLVPNFINFWPFLTFYWWLIFNCLLFGGKGSWCHAVSRLIMKISWTQLNKNMLLLKPFSTVGFFEYI